MSEEADFRVIIRDIRATELTSRNRFREKLRVLGDFDEKKFKTKKQVVSGGGDVNWKFSWKTSYSIYSHKLLEERFLYLRVMKSKLEEFGHLKVDLWTVATGPIEHNLPIIDEDGRTVGRLNFIVEMEQFTNIAVVFKQIKLKNLKPSGSECHPYLKYAYSRDWPVMDDGKKTAVYSQVQYNTKNPEWMDLPEVRFEATLRELLQESIVLHVTHNGLVLNTTLGRCNLLFRTLVDGGKTFKDDDLISFKGPLKIENAEIEGMLTFKFLPKLAQMKSAGSGKRPLHNENGVFDAVPLLPGLPLPKVPIAKNDEKVATTTTSNGGQDSPATGRRRATTISGKSGLSIKDQLAEANKEDDDDNRDDRVQIGEKPRNKNLDKVAASSKGGSSMNKPLRTRSRSLVDERAPSVEDLISFDSPVNLRRSQRGVNAGIIPSGGNFANNPFGMDSLSSNLNGLTLHTSANNISTQPVMMGYPPVGLAPGFPMPTAQQALQFQEQQFQLQQQQMLLMQQQQQQQYLMQQQQQQFAANPFLAEQTHSNPFMNPHPATTNPFATSS